MIKNIVLKSIKFYQRFISRALGQSCRFFPTCSQYLYITIVNQGLIKGLWQGGKRVLRCHPLEVGGVDLP